MLPALCIAEVTARVVLQACCLVTWLEFHMQPMHCMQPNSVRCSWQACTLFCNQCLLQTNYPALTLVRHAVLA